MLLRLQPLKSGRDTEIDMIEREMEGGVVVIQPADIDEPHLENRPGGLIEMEDHVEVHELAPKAKVAPKG